MTAPSTTAPESAQVGAAAAEQTLAGSALAFYALLSSLSEDAGLIAATMWDELDPTNLVGSWTGNSFADRMLLTTSVAQELAARAGQQYANTAIGLQTSSPVGGGLLVPRTLAGIASDGRNLDDLLRSPLVQTLAAVGAGAALGAVLYANREKLRTIVATQVADAGRTAAQTAAALEPLVTSYVRVLTPPSCGRCAVLAGKRTDIETAFLRHPRCDCVNSPVVDGNEDAADEMLVDPDEYFASLDEPTQDRMFTVAGAAAIREGADIAQVVNARRGASGLEQPGRLTIAERAAIRQGRPARLERVDVYGRELAVTTEGTTRRGLAGQRLIAGRAPGDRTVAGTRSQYRRAKTPRLMPEGILELAGGNRELAAELLARHGYVI